MKEALSELHEDVLEVLGGQQLELIEPGAPQRLRVPENELLQHAPAVAAEVHELPMEINRVYPVHDLVVAGIHGNARHREERVDLNIIEAVDAANEHRTLFGGASANDPAFQHTLTGGRGGQQEEWKGDQAFHQSLWMLKGPQADSGIKCTSTN